MQNIPMPPVNLNLLGQLPGINTTQIKPPEIDMAGLIALKKQNAFTTKSTSQSASPQAPYSAFGQHISNSSMIVPKKKKRRKLKSSQNILVHRGRKIASEEDSLRNSLDTLE